jgi:hypothetical protein
MNHYVPLSLTSKKSSVHLDVYTPQGSTRDLWTDLKRWSDWRNSGVQYTLSRAVAQAVSRRSLAAELRVRARVSPCGICGQSGTETGFSPISLFLPVNIISLGSILILYLIWGWTTGLLVAAVQRHRLTPTTHTTQHTVKFLYTNGKHVLQSPGQCVSKEFCLRTSPN